MTTVHRRAAAAAWLSAILILALSPAQAARQIQALPGEEVTDEIIIHLKAGVSFSQIAASFPPADYELAKWVGTRLKDRSVLALTPDQRTRLIPILARHPQVELIEPNRVRRGEIDAPNDPSFAAQWNLASAAAAWKFLPGRYLTSANPGAARVRVAVLDTGTDCTHPEFANAGGSSTNSAAGGQLSWALSRAYVATTVASPACPWQDDHGHGTHVSGIVAAATNNGGGVASLGYPLELVSMKVLNSAGSTTDVLISNAIVDAVNAGVDIISMSLGGAGYSQLLQDACNYAWSRNVLVIAAAGNKGTTAPMYPAGNNHSIGVIAHDMANLRASFSSYGTHADLAAPGVAVLSTTPTYPNKYTTSLASLSGTSMAAPHVAALAGLMMMASPGASADVITQRLERSAASSVFNGGWDANLGYGLMDVARAITGDSWRDATVGGVTGQVMDNLGQDIVGATVTLNSTTVTTIDGGQFRFSGVAPGDYMMSVAATGFTTLSVPVTIVAGADTPAHFRMGVNTGIFTGTVTSGGAPIEGAIVHAIQSGQAVGVAVTNSAGVYRLLVPAGTYDLRAGAFFRMPAVATGRTVSFGGTTNVATLNLAPMGRIEGYVRDGSSNAVSGADILLSLTGTWTRGASTNGDGFYRTLPAPAATYTAQASKAGLPTPPAANVAVVNDITARLDFSLSAAAMTLSPSSSTLGPFGTQQFSALVGGSPTSSVTWSLTPAGTGSISGTGLYTAPSSFSGTQTVTVRATHNSDASLTATATVTLNNAVTVTLGTASATGGSGSVSGNTVTLSQPAPAGGATVQLSSSNPSAASPPVSVVVPAGQQAAAFSLSTGSVTSSTPVTITATYAGASGTAGINILPPALTMTILLGNSTFAAGNTFSSGVVTLGSAAPAGGVSVTISSSNSSVLTPPASPVTIAAGATQAPFSFSTGYPASATPITLSATSVSVSGTATANATVNPLAVVSLSLGGSSALGGQSQAGNTVTLSGNAPAGGAAVTLGTANSAALQVPAFTVPAGAKTANFTFTTSPVGTATAVNVSASLGGATSTAGFTVNPPSVVSLALGAASVNGGSGVAGNTVTLNGPAPAAGLTVTLSSSNTSAAQVPSPFVIPGGASSATFSLTTSAVSSNTPVTIGASFNGSSANAGLTVLAAGLGSVALGGSTFGAGNSFNSGVVTLASAAPSGGVNVTLSGLPSGVLQLPASVSIPGGATQATFSFSALYPGASTLVTVSATSPAGSVSTTATVTPLQVVNLTLSGSGVTGGLSQSGNVVTLSGTAPAGGASVTLSSTNTGAGQVSSPLVVPAGATSASFVITTSAVASVTPVTISASLNGSSRTAGFSVNPPGLSTFTLGSSSATGGATVTGNQVTLSNPAPSGGATVTLSSSNSSAAATPANVVVSAGATSAQFSITTSAVATDTPAIITASFNGISLTSTLTVRAPQVSTVSLGGTTFGAGNSFNSGTVTLASAAPGAGLTVNLSSSNSSLLSVPASVSVAGGATQATFSFSTGHPGASTLVTVGASVGSQTPVNANVTVTPLQVTDLVLGGSAISGGQSQGGNTVTLSGNAPAGGAVVTLGSSNSAAAQVPAPFTVPAGTKTAQFTFTTSAVASATPLNISASLNGSSQQRSFTVNPPGLSSVTLSAGSIVGGNTLSGNQVTLSQAAPVGGLLVSLVSSNPSAASVPANVTVPGGATSVSFAITTSLLQNAAANVTIQASANGASVSSGALTVNPVLVASVSLSAASVTGGNALSGNTVSINVTAPPGGVVLNVGSSNSGVAQTPATVTIPAGASSATFNIITSAVASNTPVTISASFGISQASAGLTVQAPAAPAGPQVSLISLGLTSGPGGVTRKTNIVRLTAVAPAGGAVVLLSSSNPGLLAVPASVTVPAGAQETRFAFTPGGVNANTDVVISASYGGASVSAIYTVAPATLNVFQILVNPVQGGTPTTGRLSLNGLTGSAGMTVSLASSNPGLASVPAAVNIPAGTSSVDFPIGTSAVGAQAIVTITATQGANIRQAAVTVNP